MTEHTIDVDGLRCEGCVDTVSAAILAVAGVRAVDVALETTKPSAVTVLTDEGIALDLDAVATALAKAGDFRLSG